MSKVERFYGFVWYDAKTEKDSLSQIGLAVQDAVFKAALAKMTPLWQTLVIQTEQNEVDDTTLAGPPNVYEVVAVKTSILAIE